MNNLWKIWAFTKRTFEIIFSYKLALATTFISPLLFVFMFGMIGKVFEDVEIPALAVYGGDYVSYILLGSIFWQFVSIGLSTIAEEMHDEASIGTLEAIFMSPTNITFVFPGLTFVSMIISGLFTIITITVGILFFNFNIGNGNYPLALLIAVLTYFTTLGIGMIVGGLTLIYKQIGSLVGLVTTFLMFLSGIYFPIEVLPSFLKTVAQYVPLTYALHSMRLALLQDASFMLVIKPIIDLAILSAISILIGYLIFDYAIEKARKDGSLGQY